MQQFSLGMTKACYVPCPRSHQHPHCLKPAAQLRGRWLPIAMESEALSGICVCISILFAARKTESNFKRLGWDEEQCHHSLSFKQLLLYACLHKLVLKEDKTTIGHLVKHVGLRDEEEEDCRSSQIMKYLYTSPTNIPRPVLTGHLGLSHGIPTWFFKIRDIISTCPTKKCS